MGTRAQAVYGAGQCAGHSRRGQGYGRRAACLLSGKAGRRFRNLAAGRETAFGDTAIYDLGKAILVLKGRKVRFVTAEDEVTADRQLEYWETKQMVVARGNAYAVRGAKRLRADVLSAHLRKNKGGKTKIYRVDAFDNVHIVTEQDTITADRGVYDVESATATLTGSVKLSRDDNQLNGCSAEVNLNTGISKLRSCTSPGTGKSRVRGFFLPRNIKKK